YLENGLGVIGKWIAIILTFHLVCFGWILFRADVTTLGPILSSIRGAFGNASPEFIVMGHGILVLGAAVLATDYIGYRKGVEFPDLFRNWHPAVCGLLAA